MRPADAIGAAALREYTIGEQIRAPYHLVAPWRLLSVSGTASNRLAGARREPQRGDRPDHREAWLAWDPLEGGLCGGAGIGITRAADAGAT